MSTSLKRLFGILIVGVALSLGITAALPVMAEAQDMDEASMDAGQNPVENAGVATTTQPATEPQAALRVVNPGDSLWSIGQEHLGPGAASDQVQEEAEKIYDINRDRIGDDPNLILVGQELLMPPAPESVPQPAEGPVEPTPPVSEESTPQSAEEPVAAEPAPAESAVLPDSSEAQDTPEAGEVASDNSSSFAPFANLNGIELNKLLGLGIILLTLVVAILMAWKLPMDRSGKQREGASTTPKVTSPDVAPQDRSVQADNAPAGGEVQIGSGFLEQDDTLLLVGTMLEEMRDRRREEHGAAPQRGISERANATNGPREAEGSPSGVPVHKRLRLVDAPPDEHEGDHQRRSSAGVGK